MLNMLLNGIMTLGFSIPIFSEIFLWLDGFIYKIADYALQAFFEMVNISGHISVYSDAISAISSRLMVLAGVYALFRLSVMVINYLINPEKVAEATKNGTTFVKNLVIAVVLLAASNTIFTEAGKLQTAIITNNVIPNIIYGAGNEFSIKKESKKLVNNIFLIFFEPETDCSNNNAPAACQKYIAVADGDEGISHLEGLQYSSGFNYTPVISGIVGILLIYYFVTYAIELAVRLLKLVVLQVIAPVPIILSIDPSQKDRLKNFASTYLNVWVQVFVRMITIYLAFVVCGLVANVSDIVDVDTATAALASNGLLLELNFMVRLILYIGIFQGAKELPKLIDDVIGTKLASSSTTGSFGNVLKGIVGGGVGLVGGGVAGGVAGATTGGAGNIIQGALTGAASGVWNGAKARNAKDLIGAASTTVGSIRGAHGVAGSVIEKGGIGLAAAAGVRNFFGGQGRDQRAIAEFDKKIGDINKSKENINTASGKRTEIQNKLNDMYAKKTGFNSLEDYLSRDQELNRLKNAQMLNEQSGFYFKQNTDGTTNEEYRQIDLDRIKDRTKELTDMYNVDRDSYSKSQFNIAQGYIQNPSEMQAQGYTLDDADLATMISDYNKYVTEHHMAGEERDIDRRLTDYSQISQYVEKDRVAIRNHDREIENVEEQKRNRMNDPMYKASNLKSGSKK